MLKANSSIKGQTTMSISGKGSHFAVQRISMVNCRKCLQAALLIVLSAIIFFVIKKSYGGHLETWTLPLEAAWTEVATGKQPTTNKAKFEPSFPGDHPSMVYFRQYGRLNNLPTDTEMVNMSEKELQHIYHSYLDNIDYLCKRKIRMGTVFDGGYETCDDYQYRPGSPCLVYSFGIRGDFSFDNDAEKLYGCDVHSFDPSMGEKSHQRSSKAWFYQMGIGGDAHQTSKALMSQALQTNWVVKTMTEIKAKLHHQNRTLDILKMDIEASEWPTLENMVATGELSKVRQLLIEFHFDPTRSLQSKVSLLQKIESLGFRRFRTNFFTNVGSRHKKKESPEHYPVERILCCYEMGFVNERLARPLGKK